MSFYYNQTNITPGTSQFITRKEIIDGFSTLVGDLSGANISSILTNPNPLLSSITMNPAGNIDGANSVQGGNFRISTTTGALGTAFPVAAFAFPVPSITDVTGTNYRPLWAQSVAAANATNTTTLYNNALIMNSSNIFGSKSTSGVADTFLTYNPSFPAGSNFALNNVSSINGNPPTGGTIFTNLTGSNLTTTGTLTSPQIVSLSSINGLQFSTPLVSTWTGGGSTVVASGSPVQVASITLPAGYLKINSTYIVDVPLSIGVLPPSPTNFTLFIGIRLGANGLVNYQVPYFIATGSGGNVPIQITSIIQTNQFLVSTQTIDIVVLQQSGSTWTCNLQAPGSGFNTYTIKPL